MVQTHYIRFQESRQVVKMAVFLNIVKNDAGMSGRNWQIFDLNIIAHFLAKGFLTKVPILKNTALKRPKSTEKEVFLGFRHPKDRIWH